MTNDFKNLSNIELIRLCAQNPRNKDCWTEFANRFHHYICMVIYRVSKKYDFTDGILYMEDYAQEVYIKLLRNNARALKNFQGRYENAIYTYLETIAIRIILNEVHIKNVKINISDDKKSALADRLEFNNWKNPFDWNELKEEIEVCLKKILAQSQKMQRDLFIFKLYLFEDLQPKIIATKLKTAPSQKTISNVIANYKTPLKECLEQRLN